MPGRDRAVELLPGEFALVLAWLFLEASAAAESTVRVRVLLDWLVSVWEPRHHAPAVNARMEEAAEAAAIISRGLIGIIFGVTLGMGGCAAGNRVTRLRRRLGSLRALGNPARVGR